MVWLDLWHLKVETKWFSSQVLLLVIYFETVEMKSAHEFLKKSHECICKLSHFFPEWNLQEANRWDQYLHIWALSNTSTFDSNMNYLHLFHKWFSPVIFFSMRDLHISSLFHDTTPSPAVVLFQKSTETKRVHLLNEESRPLFHY